MQHFYSNCTTVLSSLRTRTVSKYVGIRTLSLLFLLTFAMSISATEVVLFEGFTEAKNANYFKEYTLENTAKVTATTPVNIASSSGDYYVSLGSTPSNGTVGSNYVGVKSSLSIKTVSFLLTANGKNKTLQPVLVGWKQEAVDKKSDIALSNLSVTSVNKGKDNAQWLTYDLSGKGIKEVRLYRAIKGLDAGDGVDDTRGNGQTLQVYGIKLEIDNGSTTYYTVSFNTNNHGDAIDNQTIESGKYATEPTAPTADGYTFGGWYTDNETFKNKWNFTTDKVTKDTTLFAKWTAIPPAATYKVTFAANGHGTAPAELTGVASGSTISEPTPAPTATDGYTFDGWYKEAACTTPWNFATDKVTDNITLYAKWVARKYAFGCYVFEDSETIGTNPKQTAGNFSAPFYIDNISFSAMNVVYEKEGTGDPGYGGWKIKTKNAQISFYVENDSKVLLQSGAYRSGQQFTITYTDATTGKETSTTVAANTTIEVTAKADTKVTITTANTTNTATLKRLCISANENTLYLSNQTTFPYYAVWCWKTGAAGSVRTMASADCANYMVSVPAECDNVIFMGSSSAFTDGSTVRPGDDKKITSDLTIPTDGNNCFNGTDWGAYTPSLSVSFDMNGHGSAISDQCIAKGGTVVKPTDPTVEGWTFIGWYTNQTCTAAFDFSTAISAATTLYAGWTENLTSPVQIKGAWDNWKVYDLEKKAGETGSVAYITLNIAAGTYQYGFMYNGKFYKVPAKGAKPMTRETAHGTEWLLYPDGANIDGGLTDCQLTADYTGNYTFRVDYTDAGCLKVTVTYPAVYTIQYDANMPTAWGKTVPFYAANIPTDKASVVSGESYTIASATPQIQESETENYVIYTFAGWNTQADGKGTTYQPSAQITGVSADITLYAQWTPREFSITYYDADQTTKLDLTPNKYTYPVSVTFPILTKKNYTFGGWKLKDATEPIQKTDGYYGDFTLYAVWETFSCGEMMRATITGAKTSEVTGPYAGSAEVNVASGNSTDGYKLGSNNNFVKLTLADGATFQDGDYVVVNVTKTSKSLELFADEGITRWRQIPNVVKGENIIWLPEAAFGKNTVYLYRTSSEMNPFVTYMSIVRSCCTKPDFQWIQQPAKSYNLPASDFEMLAASTQSKGAVTYMSNDEKVATIVNGNKLHFVGEGSVTITATLAADGDYCEMFLSTTFDVVDECGEAHIYYNLPAGKGATALAEATSVEATTGLTAQTTITANDIKLGADGVHNDGEDLTVSISNNSSFSNTKYLAFGYTVAAGQCFTPCQVKLKVQPISSACKFRIEMTDGTSTWTSEDTQSMSAGVVSDIRFSNAANISFSGDVTLKIYSYGSTKGYRLGTPVRILGTVADVVTATIVPDGGVITDAAALGWTLQADGNYTKSLAKGCDLTMPAITRDGYTFTSYHDHNKDVYYAGNTFPLNQDYTFTAQWRADTPAGSVAATLDLNGGTLADETGWTKQVDGTYIQILKEGSEITLPLPAKTDFRFLYYTDETNDEYDAATPFVIDNDYLFTAQWCPESDGVSMSWSETEWTYDAAGAAPTLSVTGLPTDAQIKYTSSNTAIAIISDDGKTIKAFMEGETTISAVYDGDVDHCPVRASYTLHVECNEPTPLIKGEGVLTGCNDQITLRVVQQADGSDYPSTGYSFQWYKDGKPIDGATKDTYTIQTVGEYFVVVHGSNCYAQSVNRAVITAGVTTPEVTTLTRFQFYRPGHDYTDNANIRHLFAYKSAGADNRLCQLTIVRKRSGVADEEITDQSFLHTTDAADADGFYTVTATLNEISEALDAQLQQGDTLLVTLTPYDNCGKPSTAYAKSVGIRIIDKPALAFIVSGSKNGNPTRAKEEHKLHGDFITDVNRADLCEQSGSKWAASDINNPLPLYTAIQQEFEVVPVNGYAEFNLLNYEPFDIVMLTDFVKTDAVSKKNKPAYGVLDSLAFIVDYRPMFSLKGHMAKKGLDLWASKGFIADPKTPASNPQQDMTVLCYAHGIFNDIPAWDKTKGIPAKADSLNYIIRDADDNIVVRITNGGGYDKKKALQGFVAVDATNFVNIAVIPDGAGKLITCCERQTDINARLLILSINADATSKISPVGMKAIIAGLNYLLDVEPAHVSDCSVTFHNNNDTGDHLWTTASNWSSNRMPLSEQNVQIIADCKVNTREATASAIRIKDGVTLTINSDAALKVNGKIQAMDAHNSKVTKPLTNPNVITIKADATGTGTLIHTTTDDEQLAATVELYSKAYLEIVDGKKKKYWQYIGIPITEAPVPQNFFGAYTYLYSETQGGWIRKNDGTVLYGDFSGYATSQSKPETFILKGNLVSATNRTLLLTRTVGENGAEGANLLGNSWTAPIRIDSLHTEDFHGANATIYIYNTGRDDVYGNPTYGEGSTTAGQWMTIPINLAKTAAWKGLRVIPAMQAFQVNTGEETTLSLDYNRLVRSTDVSSDEINTPLRAPKKQDNSVSTMRIRVADSRTYTDIYLAQHPLFTNAFDNGWDAEFVEGDGRSASLYAITPIGEMAVAAVPEIEGTNLGFARGKETEYTFSFGYTGSMLYLNDTRERRSTLITDWNTYRFTASDDDDANRFYISATPIEAQVPSGLVEVSDNHGLLTLSNPAHENLTICLYDAAGRLCATTSTSEAITDITLPATQGVYLLRVSGENTHIVRKLTR